MYLNTSLKTCTSTCPQKTFKDISNGECTNCHSTCLSCSSSDSNHCLSCENSFLYSGECLASCPDHYF